MPSSHSPTAHGSTLATEDPSAAAAVAKGLWIRIDRWPDTQSLQSFGASIRRIEQPRSNEELALALYKWVTRCYGRSGGSAEGVKGYELPSLEMLKELHVYGQGLCDKWGRLLAEIAIGAGLHARKVVINGYMQPGHSCTNHTMCEIFYADRDGIERWHWFDPHLGRYVYTRDGSRIASLEDLYHDPSLFGNPSRSSQPFHVREDDPDHYKKWSPEDVVHDVKHCAGTVVNSILWPSSYYRPAKDLVAGETWTRLWERIDGQFYTPVDRKFNQQLCARGYRDSTNMRYVNGTVKDPDNFPYWEPYLAKDPDFDHPVKPLGNGRIVFEPDLRSPDFAAGAWMPPHRLVQSRADAPSGRPHIHAETSRELGAMVWRIQSPCILTDAELEATVVNEEQYPLSFCGFALSYDQGRTWMGVWDDLARSNRPGRQTIRLNLGQELWRANRLSLYGKYDVLLRFECAGVDPTRVGLDSLKLTNTVQLNMFAQPMLQPGANILTLDGISLKSGWAVEVETIWNDRRGEDRRHTERVASLPGEFKIETGATRPEDMRMKALSMRLVRL